MKVMNVTNNTNERGRGGKGRPFRLMATLALLMAVLSLGALCGCSGGKDNPSCAASLCLEQTKNSRHLSWQDSSFREMLDPVSLGGGCYSIVMVSGEPERLVSSKQVTKTGNTDSKAVGFRYEDEKLEFAPVRKVDDYVPEAEEVNLLKSIRSTAAELSSSNAKSCEKKVLYIVSNGIDTSSEMSMAGNGKYGDVLSADYDSLVNEMIDSSSSGVAVAEALPKLDGVDVVWYGCGRLADGSQAEVPSEYVAKLKDLWDHILKGAGASSVEFRDYSGTDEKADKSEYPFVTPVVFEETLHSLVSFDANVLGFKPNDDAYVDTDENVKKVLQPYADELKRSGAKVVILGTTAKDGAAEGCRNLGERRALRFVNDLVALGVDREQLIVCSAGYEGTQVKIGGSVIDFYHNEQPNGEWDDGIARTNRAIHVIPYSQADDVINRFSV